MFGLNDLESEIIILEDSLKCPIKNCTNYVKIQKGKFSRTTPFYCPKHCIYISPSTYEYKYEKDNLVDDSEEEIKLLQNIKKYKRECRLSRERSEDAVTWNVFRFLTKTLLLQKFLNSVFQDKTKILDTIFWSVSIKDMKPWPILNEARELFGETVTRGTEPDFVIETEDVLYFIEAKITASNKTPSKSEISEKKNNPKKYITADNSFFNNLFSMSYEEILDKQMYELMRLWLLGNWIAKERKKKFYLINLVPEKKEENIEEDFGSVINQNKENRIFKRITWESIYYFIKNNSESREIIKYFENKSFGYSNKKLCKGFLLN